MRRSRKRETEQELRTSRFPKAHANTYNTIDIRREQEDEEAKKKDRFFHAAPCIVYEALVVCDILLQLLLLPLLPLLLVVLLLLYHVTLTVTLFPLFFSPFTRRRTVRW